MAGTQQLQKLSVGDPFPELTIEAVGEQVALRERWRDGPLVVTFMRQFG